MVDLHQSPMKEGSGACDLVQAPIRAAWLSLEMAGRKVRVSREEIREDEKDSSYPVIICT